MIAVNALAIDSSASVVVFAFCCFQNRYVIEKDEPVHTCFSQMLHLSVDNSNYFEEVPVHNGNLCCKCQLQSKYLYNLNQ